MNTMELRHKLLQHINTADERLLRIVNAVFESYRESAVQEEGEEIEASVLTADQKAELDIRRERHLSGESKSYSWEEVKKNLIDKHDLSA